MSIIGHSHTISDLKRLAENGDLSHGYIFYGPAMVGKCLVAKSFANYLERGDFSVSAQGGSPSSVAEPLRRTGASGGKGGGILQDSVLIEADEKGTLGIDKIRQLKNFLWHKPVLSLYRTAIVDDAELMTQEAQNAFLKIAEEPPQSTFLILVTSDIEALTPTLRSRLASIYFSVLPKGLVSGWLVEKFGISKKAAQDLALQSLGKLGLASRLVNDKELQDYLKSAETLLKSSFEKRRDVIKKILENDDLDFNKFLDAMILRVAPDASKGDYKFWHKLVELRGEAAYFNLNPRLQLENLLH